MTTVLLHEGSAAPKLEPPPRPQVRAVRGGNHGLNRVRHVMRTAVIVLILAVFWRAGNQQPDERCNADGTERAGR